ncbi:hypothetical protein [Streptomyces sp. S.PB5]|uniref:hypothetical protein n=1 Tax=Streptomyces sp. S.PB5 TaxID=3020844 RepID=UPI00339D5320
MDADGRLALLVADDEVAVDLHDHPMRLAFQTWLTSRRLVAKTVSVLQFGFGLAFGLGFALGFVSDMPLGLVSGSGAAGWGAVTFAGTLFVDFGDGLGFSAT